MKNDFIQKQLNKDFAILLGRILGNRTTDEPQDRFIYPRLIRLLLEKNKIEPASGVKACFDWAMNLRDKQGKYYWGGRPVSLRKLYYRILPLWLSHQAHAGQKRYNEMKKDLLSKSVIHSPEVRSELLEQVSKEERKTCG
jgi:hypothetical protein